MYDYFAFRLPDDFLFGTFLPARHASEMPMAIACLRLVTFLPARRSRVDRGRLDIERNRSERVPMTASVEGQVHSKFKLFSGALGTGGSLGKLATDVEAFARSAKAAPKSIGVEYLEHSKEVVVSLGYRDDEAAYPIKLHTVSLGKVDKLGPGELSGLEKKMGEAAAKVSKIICHELLVTGDREFIMVFMSHAA